MRDLRLPCPSDCYTSPAIASSAGACNEIPPSVTKSVITAGVAVSKPTTSSIPASFGSAIEKPSEVIATTIILAGMPIFTASPGSRVPVGCWSRKITQTLRTAMVGTAGFEHATQDWTDNHHPTAPQLPRRIAATAFSFALPLSYVPRYSVVSGSGRIRICTCRSGNHQPTAREAKGDGRHMPAVLPVRLP